MLQLIPSILLRVTLVLVAAFSFTACRERSESSDLYAHLLLNPDILKNEMAACQDAASFAKETTPRCMTVIKAADQMMALLEEQQKYPEKFGQKILRAQMELSKSDTIENRDNVKLLLLVVGLSSPE